MSELPATYWSAGTRDTNNPASDTVKKMLSVPAANATANTWTRLSTPRAEQTGMLARSAARPRSAAIMVARRWPRRSTQAPACRANSRLGSQMRALR